MKTRIAQLLVGTCMATALSISGLLSSTPAAHANGGITCLDFPLISVLECNYVNVRGHMVTIDISNLTSNIVVINNILSNSWTFPPFSNGTPAEILTAVKGLLNSANIFTCFINVTIVGEGSASGSC